MKSLLAQLVQGRPLTTEQAASAFEQVMTGQATPAQLGAMLAMMQQRGPTVDEITGAAMVMREKAVKVAVPAGLTIIDTCGTGGDGAETFNISTAAALVAAAAGRPKNIAVAKHGNRSVTSKSGSSTVLETLGVKLTVAPETLTRCLDEAGICFCFAPAHHPAMKFAAPVRQELGFRTLFNILGPLTNPAQAKRQVLGVFNRELTDTLANVLLRLGAESAMVVHGEFDGGGIDELSTTGTSVISEVYKGRVRMRVIKETIGGLSRAQPPSLRVDSPARSAEVIRQVLSGKPGPAADIVALNAAAALIVAGLMEDFPPAIDMARDAMKSGEPMRVLERLVAITSADAT
jgi:anthranilate phosphoribosyltransferase